MAEATDVAAQLVPETFVDASRRRRSVSATGRAAVLDALVPLPDPREPPPVLVAPRGSSLDAAGELTLEDGTSVGRVDAVPPDAPFGYHRLLRDDGVAQLLITGPGRCWLPAGLRAWGWAVQLPTTRSRRSWGIGDLADLRALSAWAARTDAGFAIVSPLVAPNPGPHPEASPYFPSTRRFGNPILLAVDELPRADAAADLAADGRALNGEPLVDRGRVWRVKRAALERIWEGGAFDRAAFEAWRAELGGSLERWAVFATLSERLGPGWRTWPETYRHPGSAAVARVARDEAERVAFHAWLQWCFDRQLEAASAPLRRFADVPVGFDPGGFDAWEWQDALAAGVSIGAPPDRFNRAGQDWGMPPFVPHRLAAEGFGPFIETIRAQLRHAGGLRIDHVIGLFRLWWIPAGLGPADGAYVRQPTEVLLEILAIESARAGAIVIGEDLGTLPAGARRVLGRRRLLSTRLAYFERLPPERLPPRALAAVTTHDLPTIAGAWTGADLDDQAAAGVTPDPDGLAILRARLAATAGVSSDASLEEVTFGLHRALGASPAMLVAATLEDALRVERRPNLPGTTGEQRPNWSLPLPVPLGELEGDRRVRSVIDAVAAGRA